MIYPTFNILPNQNYSIHVYDTEFDPIKPIVSIDSNLDETFNAFYGLLSLFISQYNDGFEEGYANGLDDSMEGIEEY